MSKLTPHQTEQINQYLQQVEMPTWLIEAHAYRLMMPREGGHGLPSPEEATLIACTVYLGRRLQEIADRP